jgi:hypothetical protein
MPNINTNVVVERSDGRAIVPQEAVQSDAVFEARQPSA